MRKRKKALILGIILLVLALGIGYAYLTTTLTINGVTDVDSNNWNVYWSNPQVTEGSVTGTQVTTAPTIDTNKTTVSFQVRLSKPGDYYEFTIDAKNDGSIDAMIENITKTDMLPDYLLYYVTYEDLVPINNNQLLKAGEQEKIRIRVEFNKDIYEEDLPTTPQSLNLTFGANYIQADSTAVPSRTEVYYVGYPMMHIGNETQGFNTFDNYEDAIADYGHPYFIKQVVSNNIVYSSYIGFFHKGNLYYLRGAISNSDTGPYYEENKNVLLEAFEGYTCGDDLSLNGFFHCYSDELQADINNYGTDVQIGGYNFCAIDSYGGSRCA